MAMMNVKDLADFHLTTRLAARIERYKEKNRLIQERRTG